jgi:hypothetical protein
LSGQSLHQRGWGVIDGAIDRDMRGGGEVLDGDRVASDGDPAGDLAGFVEAVGEQVHNGDAEAW